jgi:hypothetical protein
MKYRVFCRQLREFQLLNRLIIKVLDEMLAGGVRDRADKRGGRVAEEFLVDAAALSRN